MGICSGVECVLCVLRYVILRRYPAFALQNAKPFGERLVEFQPDADTLRSFLWQEDRTKFLQCAPNGVSRGFAWNIDTALEERDDLFVNVCVGC